ncbi:sulfatase-like hydrolase/transferase [Clostridiales bacterium BX7]|uniref:Sulfatase-like hydrolase/transferase n=2 Tax=Feifania hominis TaxID=2763660 RepID=A0A926HUW9_9FIRM|nr:sulfatase-like hydrolase/transferase [Feifania hominis]
MELLFRFLAVGQWGFGVVRSLFFALFAGVLMGLLCSLFGRIANFVLSAITLFVAGFFFSAQLVYHDIFKTYFTFYSVRTGTGQVMGFFNEMMAGIWHNLLGIVLFMVPFIWLLIFGRHVMTFRRIDLRRGIVTGAAAVLIECAAILLLLPGGKEMYSAFDLYFHTDSIDQSMAELGLGATMRVNLHRTIFPPEATIPIYEPEDDPGGSDEPDPSLPTEPVVYEPNVMEIDFDSLIANGTDETLKKMDEYFSQVEPTLQNEYTGMFKGYNLIMLTAEGFSSYAVDEELTPTLYKLTHEGFQFNNFYNPIWGVSTSDGEYVACTGLLPKGGVWSFYRSGSNAMPFGLGNQFHKLDYSTRAYHNHTWKYYKRHISHPNMGYDYKAVGNGLNVKRTWPESDLEMMQVTIPEYIDDQPFHTYYMTVSGHLQYTFVGNAMSAKNRALVEHLDMSDPCKAYLAANIELDRALEYLIEQLEAKGIADKTVIVLSADHYPYGLEKEFIDEFAGHEVDETFELYKSSLIIWTKGLPHVEVDRVCSSLDILPTVSNLFGLDYDSRLLMGRDIFSTSSPLVIFNSNSFITDRVKYNAKTKTAESLDGTEVDEEYLSQMKKIVKNKFSMSANILDQNYYAHVLPVPEPVEQTGVPES